MNVTVMMGRLTKDPEVRYGGASNTAIARFSIAVNRRFQKENEPKADFFNCVCFGKTAEFVEKYFKKGSQIAIFGELRNNNYTNKDGQKVYATEILVNNVEFAGSKSDGGQAENNSGQPAPAPMNADEGGFMNVPDGIDEELPFK